MNRIHGGGNDTKVYDELNQIASLAASLATMYSASVVESAIVVYFELFQETAPQFKVNRNPYVDLLSSRFD